MFLLRGHEDTFPAQSSPTRALSLACQVSLLWEVRSGGGHTSAKNQGLLRPRRGAVGQ